MAAFGLVPLLFVAAYASESDAPRYHSPAYVALAVLGAYGISSLVQALHPPLQAALVLVAFVGFATLLAADFQHGVKRFAQRDLLIARGFTDDVVAHSAPNAIIVAPWLYATPLAYRSYVEHRFGERIVVTAWPRDVARSFPA